MIFASFFARTHIRPNCGRLAEYLHLLAIKKYICFWLQVLWQPTSLFWVGGGMVREYCYREQTSRWPRTWPRTNNYEQTVTLRLSSACPV